MSDSDDAFAMMDDLAEFAVAHADELAALDRKPHLHFDPVDSEGGELDARGAQ